MKFAPVSSAAISAPGSSSWPDRSITKTTDGLKSNGRSTNYSARNSSRRSPTPTTGADPRGPSAPLQRQMPVAVDMQGRQVGEDQVQARVIKRLSEIEAHIMPV